MSPRCTGEPVSWLRLEQYHLGAIRGDERKRIDEHLASCPACAACFARIEQDEAVALPALPAMTPPRRVLRGRWRVQAAAAVGTLAAAAAVVLAIRGTGHPVDGGPGTPGNRVKGDAIAFTLVRDDGERIEGAGGVYRDGDRFKAIVTCPPGLGGAFDVVVYDDGGVSFPLAPSHGVECGNDVPIPGAFRLTGSGEETVCLVWNAGTTVDRNELAGGAGVTGGPGLRICKRLSGTGR